MVETADGGVMALGKTVNLVSARLLQLFRKTGVKGEDAEWFPMWLERYAKHTETHGHLKLSHNRT